MIYEWELWLRFLQDLVLVSGLEHLLLSMIEESMIEEGSELRAITIL